MSEYELVIIGANESGLSLLSEAIAAGVDTIALVDRQPLAAISGAEAIGDTAVTRIRDGSPATVETASGDLLAEVVVVSAGLHETSLPPAYSIPDTLADRVHFSYPEVTGDQHVLVVGSGETAADYCHRLVENGFNAALAMDPGAFDSLASITRERLLQTEAAGQATIFWQSQPTGMVDVGGSPLVKFEDRRTPDLVFDHVIYALGGGTPEEHFKKIGVDYVPGETDSPTVYVLGDEDLTDGDLPFAYVSPGHAWKLIRDNRFPELGATEDLTARPALMLRGLVEQLRERHYNATISAFENAHSDLWLIRVKPDGGVQEHAPGQYATLGLGYWEPRLDGLDEHLEPDKVEKMVRRSYSISSSIIDESGELLDPSGADDIEFYVVLVRPEGLDVLPELTPRLALKTVGDRLYMGPKIVGRYTLRAVTDPETTVLFLSTGTGEAPHNYMLAELLRRGHRGKIVAACTVRYERDLAYVEIHRKLEQKHPNYTYVPLTTREADTINNKVYIQDLISGGKLEELLDGGLDPASTHVFLCGNPAMIGLPEWDGDSPTWPEVLGVCQLLHERGFTVDRHGVEGNVHFEEYW